MKRTFMMIIALLFLGLALLGVFLPVLPTTPFLLCASVFGAKSSDRFHQWLTHTSVYQNHLDDFVTKHTMKRKSKQKILILATLMMACAFYFSKNFYARIIIGLLVLFKYYYFIFKIADEDEETALEDLKYDQYSTHKDC
ncbi:YbaN family protein [Erysipelothrix rhusiopathiae]|nr:YbaN family protein [Erysipelothrix rhusiopathiae]